MYRAIMRYRSPPMRNCCSCHMDIGIPWCPRVGWCRACWNWVCNVLREVRDFYRDFVGTLPKRSFYESATDYYDWLVEIICFAGSLEQDTRLFRRRYDRLNQNLKRSRRLLLVAFFEHYEANRRNCAHDARTIITMMVDYCKMAHPDAEGIVVSEFLKRAILKKHYEVSRVLLDMIDHIDTPFVDRIVNPNDILLSTNERPLSVAVQTGDVKIVSMILERGALIDTEPRSTWERPVLLLAAQKKCIKVTQMLLKHGADPYVKDQGGRGALHWLVHGGNLGIAKIYIELGLSPASKDSSGVSALTEAVTYNDPNMVRFFLDYCDLTEQDLNDALRASVTPEMERRLPIIRMLLLRGADPDGGPPPTPYRWTVAPLSRAVAEDLYMTTFHLLLAGADINKVLRSEWRFSKRIRRLLIKNVVERLEAGETVCTFYDLALRTLADSTFVNCQDERRRMPQTTIIPGVNYAAVMECDEGAFTAAMRKHGDNFAYAFECGLMVQFPLYAEDLRYRFELMRNKWEGKWQVEKAVSGMWGGMLPSTVTSKIADYLHPNDLKVVEPDMAYVDDLGDLAYPRGRINFQCWPGIRPWRRRAHVPDYCLKHKC